MLIGGISPYSKVVGLRVVNSSENLWCFKLDFFSNFFVRYITIKSPLIGGISFTMQKVVNNKVPKNNPLYQFYPITAFQVVFYHPSGFTEMVTVKGVSHESTFEIFNSNGAWAMLFGKPLLWTFNMIHDYTEDTIWIPQGKEPLWVTLSNQFTNEHSFAAKLLTNCTKDIKQLVIIPKEEDRETPRRNSDSKKWRNSPNRHKIQGGLATPLKGSLADQLDNELRPSLTNEVIRPKNINTEQEKLMPDNPNAILLLNDNTKESTIVTGAEQPDTSRVFEPTILTRKIQLHNPAWVVVLLAEITIWSDLMAVQLKQVQEMIARRAKCFTLNEWGYMGGGSSTPPGHT